MNRASMYLAIGNLKDQIANLEIAMEPDPSMITLNRARFEEAIDQLREGWEVDFGVPGAAEDYIDAAIRLLTGEEVHHLPHRVWEGRVALGIDQCDDWMLYYCDNPFDGIERKIDKIYRAVLYEIKDEE